MSMIISNVRDHRITCRIVDSNKVITQVGIAGEKYSVAQIYDWIKTGTHSFYTDEKGRRAKVFARKSSTGRPFITTDPDGIEENNLDELPSC